MSSPAVTPTLRPATAEDAAFAFAAYAGTRRDEFAPLGWTAAQLETLLKSQFAAQQHAHRTAFPEATRSIILLHGEPAGTLVVQRTDTEIRLVDIALLPAQRDRGVGGYIVAGLIAEAEASGRPLRLSVARTNRALRLYLRLGFTASRDDGMYWEMERTPPVNRLSGSQAG